jgi:hypothetical protein
MESKLREVWVIGIVYRTYGFIHKDNSCAVINFNGTIDWYDKDIIFRKNNKPCRYYINGSTLNLQMYTSPAIGKYKEVF